jgi:uncharacterized protein (DUF1778 family)
MTQTQNRQTPINIRALTTQRALIDRAAKAVNKSRSEFMLEAACREAENVLLDQRLFYIDDDGFERFEKILATPPDKSLTELLNTEAPWES